MSAAPRQWGGGEPDTADSGNEICVVICARSGRGPWALANLTEELRSREVVGAETQAGVEGAETQAGVEGAPAGVCVWVPWGVCICAFWFSQSVCVFPWFMWTSFKGMLGEHLASCSCVEISRVCVCVCVYTTTHSWQFGVYTLYHTPPPQQPAGPNRLRNRAGVRGQGTQRVVLGELGPGGGPGLAGNKGPISGEATRALAD